MGLQRRNGLASAGCILLPTTLGITRNTGSPMRGNVMAPGGNQTEAAYKPGKDDHAVHRQAVGYLGSVWFRRSRRLYPGLHVTSESQVQAGASAQTKDRARFIVQKHVKLKTG